MAEPAEPPRVAGFRSVSIFFHAALAVLSGLWALAEAELFYYVDVEEDSKGRRERDKVRRLDHDFDDDRAAGG